MEVLILLLLASLTLVTSQTIVETLPGYPGPLPFKLETGYIGVGEDEAVQLFYYFVESEGNPLEDPLMVWLSGGPGCTTLHAFFFEIGPMKIMYGKYIDNVPALRLDPNSWTKTVNVLYVEAPTLTGFSYTKTPESVRSSDTVSASQTAEFVRKFIRDHPKFSNNPLYVTGISYSGIIIPIVTEELYKGNDEGLQPTLNIRGYVAGNPLTDKNSDINSRFEYSYHMGLISEELYESARKNCLEEYAQADSNNLLCMSAIDEVDKRIERINDQRILDVDCDPPGSLVRGGNPIFRGNYQKSHLTNQIRMLSARSSFKDTNCDVDIHDYAAAWANNKDVMKALGVREGTVKEFVKCNLDMKYNYGELSMPLYDFNVQSSVVYHQNLTKRNCRALIFSGDHDLRVPHSGTLKWIKSLNLTMTDSNWDAWYSNRQVGGYKTTFARDNYTLVFATLKGAGHTASEDKPREGSDMIKRWFAHRPI
uniref:serine carboxypeptidase-like 18 n=1 Tax=Erigeron canadensis TaxID=72917 RepID=UPI001CB8B561|nr:serine carboxypeptidase-like 18 [Erigeron canadensis]